MRIEVRPVAEMLMGLMGLGLVYGLALWIYRGCRTRGDGLTEVWLIALNAACLVLVTLAWSIARRREDRQAKQKRWRGQGSGSQGEAQCVKKRKGR